MKKINYLILLVVVFIAISCEPKYEKQYSWAYPIAGDWSVHSYNNDGSIKGGPYEIKSYNSSFGQDSIWFDDYATKSTDGHFWSMKYKVSANMNSKTFETKGSTNAISGYNISIIVNEGKIIDNDSIYFKIIFSDDPESTYILAGHRANKYDDYMQ